MTYWGKTEVETADEQLARELRQPPDDLEAYWRYQAHQWDWTLAQPITPPRPWWARIIAFFRSQP